MKFILIAFLTLMPQSNILKGSSSLPLERVRRQNKRSYLETKEARKARKEEMMALNQVYEEEEGLIYGAGITDQHLSPLYNLLLPRIANFQYYFV